MKATATARAVAANATNCLKPWASGINGSTRKSAAGDQTATSTCPRGPRRLAVIRYIPPTATDPGNGFTEHDASGNPTYYGYQMILKLSNPGQGANQIPINSAGWAAELCLDNASTNNPCNTPAYNANITGCTSDTVAISPPGSTCTVVDPTQRLSWREDRQQLGTTTPSTWPTSSPITIQSATWSDGAGGSWQTGKINTTQAPSSRIVPVAIVDIPEYMAAGYSGSNGIARVVNIVGFFLEGTCATVSAQESYLQCPGHGNDASSDRRPTGELSRLERPNGRDRHRGLRDDHHAGSMMRHSCVRLLSRAMRETACR